MEEKEIYNRLKHHGVTFAIFTTLGILALLNVAYLFDKITTENYFIKSVLELMSVSLVISYSIWLFYLIQVIYNLIRLLRTQRQIQKLKKNLRKLKDEL